MSRLTDDIVLALLELSNDDKEHLGSDIVLMLGGDPTKQVTGLPKRRGNADGGIDGRIPILREVKNAKMRPNGTKLYECNEIYIENTSAAVCIKIEKNTFTRGLLGGFILDMERERLFEGIIINAKGLSPDAKEELERKNSEGIFQIYHLLLSDILSGKIDCPFKFIIDPKEALYKGVRDYLQNS